ncbi:U4/U6-U5 snRNP complex subunit dib1, variant 2 [Coccidioides posadasii str. Silveira]|uniref:U4/U6-U5 snRNP complex subunit dib1, variant 2 n=1 Tax=Coccidioides posadasii (strain RMSCC 757 / Silveira) TaxID=443226 RepID=UPI001BEE80DE|nr:U4/U6-U5 snRNP complex subunit dib1, variant 2 [Coccidioides posadasii str. Silveira]
MALSYQYNNGTTKEPAGSAPSLLLPTQFTSEGCKSDNSDEASELPDEQQIFVTYKPLLEKKSKGKLIKGVSLRNIVISHKRAAESLVERLGIDTIVKTLKSLVQKGVFHSESKAKEQFPTLFETSSTQAAEHPQSEENALEPGSEILEQVSLLDQETPQKDEVQPAGEVDIAEETKTRNSTPRKPLATTNYGALDAQCSGTNIPGTKVRSLFPPYIPYKVQHAILSKIQTLLEKSCYEFTSKWAPALASERGWDCPEAIELNRWTGNMYYRLKNLPDGALDNRYNSDISSVFASLCGLRHAAVHRLHVSVRGLDDMIHNAIIFTGMIRDTTRECQLNELHLELKRITRSQELHLHFLENRLKDEFTKIRELREELNRREQRALDAMLRENNENRFLVGELLEESFGKVFNSGLEDEKLEFDASSKKQRLPELGNNDENEVIMSQAKKDDGVLTMKDASPNLPRTQMKLKSPLPEGETATLEAELPDELSRVDGSTPDDRSVKPAEMLPALEDSAKSSPGKNAELEDAVTDSHASNPAPEFGGSERQVDEDEKESKDAQSLFQRGEQRDGQELALDNTRPGELEAERSVVQDQEPNPLKPLDSQPRLLAPTSNPTKLAWPASPVSEVVGIPSATETRTVASPPEKPTDEMATGSSTQPLTAKGSAQQLISGPKSTSQMKQCYIL